MKLVDSAVNGSACHCLRSNDFKGWFDHVQTAVKVKSELIYQFYDVDLLNSFAKYKTSILFF